MTILLTNDDGYQSEGIAVLEMVLTQAGHEIWVCAPSDEQSAQSHAMTLKGKVKFTRYDERHYHCSGKPADCILYGLEGNAIPVVPDVVISGINHGYNASTDIIYSGTVGAASEAALRGYPAIAISARMDQKTRKYPFIEAASFLAKYLDKFIQLVNKDVILNINVPPKPNGKWKLGTIGQLEYLDVVEKSQTKRSTNFDASSTKMGMAYGQRSLDANGVGIGDQLTLSLKGGGPPNLRDDEKRSDYQLLSQNFIAVTPLVVHPVMDEATALKLEEIIGESDDI
jgi:5'-nucleotidase